MNSPVKDILNGNLETAVEEKVTADTSDGTEKKIVADVSSDESGDESVEAMIEDAMNEIKSIILNAADAETDETADEEIDSEIGGKIDAAISSAADGTLTDKLVDDLKTIFIDAIIGAAVGAMVEEASATAVEETTEENADNVNTVEADTNESTVETEPEEECSDLHTDNEVQSEQDETVEECATVEAAAAETYDYDDNYDSNICYNCGSMFVETEDRMVCENCGTYKPKEITNEEVALLYSAFQKLRIAEFAEAESEFDDIIQRYPGCSQAYWGRLMSRYGIKYERDHDGRHIPTCYAPSIDSVLESSDYKKAMEYADEDSAEVFRDHAEYIERIRREWQTKASKEKPYDIFISFKDSDPENGMDHTVDSNELRELYFFLMRKGYRVFFSRESLLEKTGEKYEPYIYGALSSAKVMLVYGSKPEYINSPWVKNEWMRYQKRIQAGEKQPDSLIVAYKGFSPKDLPIALSSLGRQHIDAGQPGFYSDLVETINRIIESYGKYKLNSEGKIICEHEEVIVPGKAPTCTQSGWTESSHCALCGDILKPIEVLPATGHCFGEWQICKKATCDEEGLYERVCACGERETKPIASRGGHISSGEWETVKEAGAGKAGLRAKKCIVCGKHVEEMVIPALPAADMKPSLELRYRVNADKETCEIIGVGSCHETDISIPESIDGYRVTGIANEAFKEREKLTGVVIPDSVLHIGDYAFCRCPNLTSVRIGDSVTSIGIYAFYHCHALASVHIGESVETIGTYAFYECKSLTGIVLPNSVRTVEGQAFGFCENLSGVVFGESVETIGNSAFRGCKNLLTVNLPGSVEKIGLSAFSGGVSEFRVSEGNPVYSAVQGCLCSKDEKTFIQYAAGKRDFFFTVPSTVTTILNEAFRDCNALTSVTLPASLESIGKEVFKNCKYLKDLSYQGKKRHWGKIKLHDEWKSGSHIVSVSCEGGSIKLK